MHALKDAAASLEMQIPAPENASIACIRAMKSARTNDIRRCMRLAGIEVGPLPEPGLVNGAIVIQAIGWSNCFPFLHRHDATLVHRNTT